MGASYTAKPPIVIETDYPDDWSINWRREPELWPGPPFSPGYEPIYFLDIAAPAKMHVGFAVEGIAAQTTDHVDFTTSEPSTDCTFTAFFQGSPARLRFVGDAWGTSIDGAFSLTSDDDYLAELGDVEFEVFTEEEGEFITLLAEATLNNEVIGGSTIIEVEIPPDITTTLRGVMTATPVPAPGAPFKIYGYATSFWYHKEGAISNPPNAFTYEYWSQVYDPGVWDSSQSSLARPDPDEGEGTFCFRVSNPPAGRGACPEGATEGGTVEINGSGFVPGINYVVDYQVSSRAQDTPGAFTASFAFTLEVYVNGELHDSLIKNFDVPATDSGSFPRVTWCSVNGATGDITDLT